MSLLLVVFSIVRIVALLLRIIWAKFPENRGLSSAAVIFTSAGVLMMYIYNLFWATLLFKKRKPNWYLRVPCKCLSHIVVATVAASVGITVTGLAMAVFKDPRNSVDQRFLTKMRTALKYTSGYCMLIITLPVFFLALVHMSASQPGNGRPEGWGTPIWREKLYYLFSGSALLFVGAAYRGARFFMGPDAKIEHPQYFSKGLFYVLNYGIELIVLALYTGRRFSRRGMVPDGAAGSGQNQNQQLNDMPLRALVSTEAQAFGLAGDEGTLPSGAIVMQAIQARRAARQARRQGTNRAQSSAGVSAENAANPPAPTPARAPAPASVLIRGSALGSAVR